MEREREGEIRKGDRDRKKKKKTFDIFGIRNPICMFIGQD